MVHDFSIFFWGCQWLPAIYFFLTIWKGAPPVWICQTEIHSNLAFGMPVPGNLWFQLTYFWHPWGRSKWFIHHSCSGCMLLDTTIISIMPQCWIPGKMSSHRPLVANLRADMFSFQVCLGKPWKKLCGAAKSKSGFVSSLKIGYF